MRVLAVVGIGLPLASGFFPSQVLSHVHLSSTSLTHRQITQKAVIDMARLYMKDYPTKYIDQDKVMASNAFQQALLQFGWGAVKPGTEGYLRDLPEAHFDDELIELSNQLLIKKRNEVNIIKMSRLFAKLTIEYLID